MSQDIGDAALDWHLQHHHQTVLLRASIQRILVRAGAVVPEPSRMRAIDEMLSRPLSSGL